MAPRYEICVGLEKGHKTTPNTLKAKPSSAKVRLDLFGFWIWICFNRICNLFPRAS